MTLPSRAEIVAAVKGLGLLLRGDGRALLCYDLSLDGFWRSFWLPLLALLGYVLLMEPSPAELVVWEDSRTGFAIAQAVKFGLGWGLYLALVAGLCRMYGLGERFAVFIVLYNWAQGITSAATLPILAGTTWGLLPDGTLSGWSTGLLLAWLYIVARIARLSLGVSLPFAVAISVLDLMISLLLHRLVDSVVLRIGF